MPWPTTLAEQAQAVRAALAARSAPVDAKMLAKTFKRGQSARFEALVETLTSLGQARRVDTDHYAPQQ